MKKKRINQVIENYLNDRDYDKKFLFLMVLMMVVALGVYMWTAFNLPVVGCPDESIRRMIPYYIVQNNQLPDGYEIELNGANPYGFSYASYPPLPAFLATIFVKLASLVTESSRYLAIACRFGNVFLGVVAVMYLMKIGKALFKNNLSAVFLTMLVGFMPQVIFLNGYFNADSISLCSVIIILYYLILGKQKGWNISTCIKLAIGISMCVMTYYNAYGWCLIAVIYCIVTVLNNKSLDSRQKGRLILSRSLLIAGICIVLCGWYFVRNGILYHGDFLAINIRNEIAESTAAEGYNVMFCKPYADTGKGFLSMLFKESGWVEVTAKSTVGVFGGMDIFMSDLYYAFYEVVVIAGLVCSIVFLHKEKKYKFLYILFLPAMLITICLALYYSYFVDYQPQGRYIISILPAVGIMVTFGFKELGDFISSGIRKCKAGGAGERNIDITGGINIALVLVIFGVLCSLSGFVTEEVYVHDELVMEINDIDGAINFKYTPAENKRYSQVNLEIWGTEDPAEWLYAEYTDNGWVLKWPYKEHSNGTYNINVFVKNNSGHQKATYTGTFEVVNQAD